MTPHTLNGFSVLIPDIPEGANALSNFFIEDNGLQINASLFGYKKTGDLVHVKTLNHGFWQLFRLSEVGELLAGEMVSHRKGLPYVNFEKREGTKYYFDYCEPFFASSDFVNPVDYKAKFLTAHAALVSWVRSKGVEGDCYLLIKKIEQC